jgi:rhodanese-related sulfurtransferase
MSRFFEFANNHPILLGLLIALIVAFFLLESRRQGAKVSPSELGILTNNQGAKVIDLREPKEFNAGHIAGSQNIPFSRLSENIDSLKATGAPLIFVCKMGTVAGSAIVKLDHQDTYRLAGGIMNWQSSGLPLVTPKSSKTKVKS